LTTTLDAIRSRAAAYADHGTPGLHAPQDRAALLAALETVLATHRPATVNHTKYNADGTLISYTKTQDGPCVTCHPISITEHCEQCEDYDDTCEGTTRAVREPWPCATFRAITTALEPADAEAAA
jgi:hypothetical protein